MCRLVFDVTEARAEQGFDCYERRLEVNESTLTKSGQNAELVITLVKATTSGTVTLNDTNVSGRESERDSEVSR